jgi:hypothetical protein
MATMTDLEDLSQAKLVLLAIYRVSAKTGNRVPFEELVVKAWQDFPEHFSLRNHPEYPDSYKIYNRLYTTLITQRWVVSLHKQVYRLTEKGLELAKNLNLREGKEDPGETVENIIFSRDEEEFFQKAVQSRAFATWKKNKGKDLIDFDVRVFFQFSTGTPIKERKRKVATAEDAIEKAVAQKLPQADELMKLYKFLVERFPQLFWERQP